MLPEQNQKVLRLLAAVEKELGTGLPLIVGPWTGEVGHELLYWIPFVRWAIGTCGVPAERVIVVSRGDTSSWYAGVGMQRYVDTFQLMSPAELAALAGVKPKQSAASDAGGEELLRRVKASCGLGEVSRLMPHWMYRLYRYYWDADAPLEFVEQHAAWTRVVPPAPASIMATLPTDYIAVRFYFSRSFPETQGNRRFAREVIERLGKRRPVVMLNQPFVVDDHHDYQPASGLVMSVAELMSPANNLAVQTAVIGRAAAFVGTYGGLSLLPPLCGVPSFAFHSVPFTKPSHELAIRRMIERAQGAPLRVVDAVGGAAQADAVFGHVGL